MKIEELLVDCVRNGLIYLFVGIFSFTTIMFSIIIDALEEHDCPRQHWHSYEMIECVRASGFFDSDAIRWTWLE